MKIFLPLFFLLSITGFWAVAGDLPPAANTPTKPKGEGVEIEYQLPVSGLVTLV